jgi:hypothetical protein
MWRKALWIGLGLVAVLLIVAILFPIFAQSDSYSGPGVITAALLMDDEGHPYKNRSVFVHLRGHEERTLVQTNELGELLLDRHKLKVDGIIGFERFGLTVPDKHHMYHPIFWKLNPATHDFVRPKESHGITNIQWPS